MLLFVSLLLVSQVEMVPADEFEAGNKPSGLMPEHKRVRLADGHLDIVAIDAWQALFAVEPKVAAYCVTKPVEALRRQLKAKGLPPMHTELKAAGCADSSSGFVVHARRLRVGDANGFLYVMENMIEAVLSSNQTLYAEFQGISDDGKRYVVGVFKIRAKSFRDDGGELQRDLAQLRKQNKLDAKFLASLSPADFTPSLDDIAAQLTAAPLASQ